MSAACAGISGKGIDLQYGKLVDVHLKEHASDLGGECRLLLMDFGVENLSQLLLLLRDGVTMRAIRSVAACGDKMVLTYPWPAF